MELRDHRRDVVREDAFDDAHLGVVVPGNVDMLTYIPVLAFGTGLVFGFSFDTSGPRRQVAVDDRRTGVTRRPTPRAADREAADEPVTAERRATTTRDGRPVTRQREPVANDGRAVSDSRRVTDES